MSNSSRPSIADEPMRKCPSTTRFCTMGCGPGECRSVAAAPAPTVLPEEAGQVGNGALLGSLMTPEEVRAIGGPPAVDAYADAINERLRGWELLQRWAASHEQTRGVVGLERDVEPYEPPAGAPSLPKIHQWITVSALGTTIPWQIPEWNGCSFSVSADDSAAVILTRAIGRGPEHQLCRTVPRREARGWSARQWREAMRDLAMQAIDTGP